VRLCDLPGDDAPEANAALGRVLELSIWRTCKKRRSCAEMPGPVSATLMVKWLLTALDDAHLARVRELDDICPPGSGKGFAASVLSANLLFWAKARWP
jgi:hypothetical protein